MPYPILETIDEDGILDDIGVLLETIEQTVAASMQALTPQAHLPTRFERPIARTLQIKSILDQAKELAANNDIDGYHMDDGLYTFAYTKTKRWQHLLINMTNASDVHRTEDEVSTVDANETRIQISQSRGGSFYMRIDRKNTDEYGDIRHGQDTYAFSAHKDTIEHEGTGFAFDANSGTPHHNKNIHDQTQLQRDVQQIIDATLDMISAIKEEEPHTDEQ